MISGENTVVSTCHDSDKTAKVATYSTNTAKAIVFHTQDNKNAPQAKSITVSRANNEYPLGTCRWCWRNCPEERDGVGQGKKLKPEVIERIHELRALGWSYVAIGLEVHAHAVTVKHYVKMGRKKCQL